jgi:hypothetical protein
VLAKFIPSFICATPLFIHNCLALNNVNKEHL